MHKTSLKWAGGKTRLLPFIKPLLPPGHLYIEPFVGAGAVFLNTNYPRAILNDLNLDLITFYRYLQQDSAAFVKICAQWFAPPYNTAEHYYKLRQTFNECRLSKKRASLFLYLNRHGYNGLCRYNQQGLFNVPFGSYKKPYFPAAELATLGVHLQTATLQQGDYRSVLKTAPRGSVIYCDPPYVPLSPSASFTTYSPQRFTLENQEELAALAQQAAAGGAHVFISNHDLPFTRALYREAEIHTLTMPRLISCHSAARQPVSEVLAYYAGA